MNMYNKKKFNWKRYEQKCPICGSKNIEYINDYITCNDKIKFFEHIYCKDCKSKWMYEDEMTSDELNEELNEL